MTWTAAIIVSQSRTELVGTVILPAISATAPDQIIVVGAFVPPYVATKGMQWEFLAVPPMTRSTNDALIKRDVAALACTSDWIAYFSDDHKPAEDFGHVVRDKYLTHQYDVLVPARYAGQPGAHYGERLNNGEAVEELPLPGQYRDTAIGHYCGGHAGVYRLSLIQRMPWTAGPHHREWDLLQSRRHMDAGAKYCWTDQLKVWDVEPLARPWL